MLIGYVWTADSERSQLREQQHQALVKAGVATSNVYQDLNGSSRGPQPELEHCLQSLQAGDTLLVWQLDRLAYSRTGLVTILEDLAQRNIGLRVLASEGAVIDTAHVSLSVIINLIKALTEMETRGGREAKLEGIAAARARGQAFGPPRKMTAEIIRQAMKAMTESNASVAQIAKDLGITRATLYNYLNGDGSPKPAAIKLLQAAESFPESESSP